MDFKSTTFEKRTSLGFAPFQRFKDKFSNGDDCFDKGQVNFPDVAFGTAMEIGSRRATLYAETGNNSSSNHQKTMFINESQITEKNILDTISNLKNFISGEQKLKKKKRTNEI